MLPNRIASCADESSQRKILIVLYRLKNIVMDALETMSNALGPVICSTTWNSIVVAQAAAHRLLFATHCGTVAPPCRCT